MPRDSLCGYCFYCHTFGICTGLVCVAGKYTGATGNYLDGQKGEVKVIRCGKISEIGCQRIYFLLNAQSKKKWLIFLQHAIVRFNVAQCPFSSLPGFFSFFLQSGNALLVRLDDRSFTLPAAVLCCLLSV